MARDFSRIGEIITLLAKMDRRLRGRSIEKPAVRFAGSEPRRWQTPLDSAVRGVI